MHATLTGDNMTSLGLPIPPTKSQTVVTHYYKYSVRGTRIYNANTGPSTFAMHYGTIQDAYMAVKELKGECQLVTLKFDGETCQWLNGKGLKTPTFMGAGFININAEEFPRGRKALAALLKK